MPRSGSRARSRWWVGLVLALIAQGLAVTLAQPAAQAGSSAHDLATLYVNPGGGLLADGSDGLRLQLNGSGGKDEIRYRNTSQYCCSGVAPMLNIGGTLWGEAGPANGGSGTSWTDVEYVAMSGSSSATGGSDIGTGTAHVRYTAEQGGLTYVLDRKVGYTYPNSYYTDSYTLTIPAGNTDEVKFYFGGDTAPGSSDSGYGIMLTEPVRSVISLNQSSGILVGYREVAGNKAFDGATSQHYSTPYPAVRAGGDINFTVDTHEHDAGLMMEWKFGTQPGTYPATMQAFTTAQGTGLSAEFRADTMTAGGNTLLDLSVVNTSLAEVNGLGFTLNLPAGLVIATAPPAPNPSNGCGGTLTATPGSGAITLTNGSVTGADNCVTSVPVTTSTPGAYTINSGSVAALQSLSNEVGTSALTVTGEAVPPPPPPPPPPAPTSTPSPEPPAEPATCPTMPFEATLENAYGAAIARWVCRMQLVGGLWQGRAALVLLPNGWFTCPMPPARHRPIPGTEFGAWLLQVHCGYRPVTITTTTGRAPVLDPPTLGWLHFWFWR